MRQHTITVYDFDELSPKAKERAIERFRRRMYENPIYDDLLTEDFTYKLRELGLPDENIRWRLSSSQGDGVAFYGEFDLIEYLKKNKLLGDVDIRREELEDVYAVIRKSQNNPMYNHYSTMIVDLDAGGVDLTPHEEEELEKLEEEIQSNVESVSHELKSYGYAHFDHINSDEFVSEEMRANEYEFDENGDVI